MTALLRPLDFAALQTVPLPAGSVSGLAFDGTSLFFCDQGKQIIYRISMTGDVIASFPLPNCGGDTEHDGQLLWQSVATGGIVLIEPASGKEVRRLSLPDESTGLCTDGYYWYRGTLKRSEIIRFDPESGEELGTIPTVGQPEGFAYDGQYLWHGSRTPEASLLVKIDLEKELLIDQITLPFGISGLTYDGRDLLAADGSNHRLVRIPVG